MFLLVVGTVVTGSGDGKLGILGIAYDERAILDRHRVIVVGCVFLVQGRRDFICAGSFAIRVARERVLELVDLDVGIGNRLEFGQFLADGHVRVVHDDGGKRRLLDGTRGGLGNLHVVVVGTLTRDGRKAGVDVDRLTLAGVRVLELAIDARDHYAVARDQAAFGLLALGGALVDLLALVRSGSLHEGGERRRGRSVIHLVLGGHGGGDGPLGNRHLFGACDRRTVATDHDVVDRCGARVRKRHGIGGAHILVVLLG